MLKTPERRASWVLGRPTRVPLWTYGGLHRLAAGMGPHRRLARRYQYAIKARPEGGREALGGGRISGVVLRSL